jgi:hypothetical protein
MPLTSIKADCNEDQQSVYVLNQVQRYGLSGVSFSTTLGVYSNDQDLESEMALIRKKMPNTSDCPYHFEVLTVKMNQVGQPKEIIDERRNLD